MFISKLSNYLKMYRKRSGLTQSEVAFLLGCENGSKVSRYERQSRVPHLKTLLAYKTIFGVSLGHLYSGTYFKISEEVKQRARKLLDTLLGKPMDRRTLSKIGFLKRIAAPEMPSDDGPPTSI